MGTYLEHTAIPAKDTKALTEWYCDHFGLRVVYEGEGENPIYFVKGEKGSAVEIIPAGQGDYRIPDPVDKNVRHLSFWVDDFDREFERLKSEGIEMEDALTLFDGDVKVSFGNDPEGNRLQIVWRRMPLPG